jgi:hypothetical protein
MMVWKARMVVISTEVVVVEEVRVVDGSATLADIRPKLSPFMLVASSAHEPGRRLRRRESTTSW